MANSDKWKALARYLSCENVPRKPRCGPALDKIYGQNPCIVVILGYVHTNAFSFENGYNMMRLSLCPHINTLSVFNENASIWKRYWKWMKTTTLTLVWLVWTVENESNENDDRARSMRLEVNFRHRNVQFYRFRAFSCGQSKTHQNGRMEANLSKRFQWQRKRILLKTRYGGQGLIYSHAQIKQRRVSLGIYS